MLRRVTVVLLALAMLMAASSPAWATDHSPPEPAAAGLTALDLSPSWITVLSCGLPHELAIKIKDAYPGYKPVPPQQATLDPVIPYTPSDLNTLARLITVEAGGQSYQTQVAVGAVVVNRVQSVSFPNSLREVVFQRGQFPPATNGKINRRVPTSVAYKAALEALMGADPTNGCLFFNAVRCAGPSVLRRSGRVILDQMIFTR